MEGGAREVGQAEEAEREKMSERKRKTCRLGLDIYNYTPRQICISDRKKDKKKKKTSAAFICHAIRPLLTALVALAKLAARCRVNINATPCGMRAGLVCAGRELSQHSAG